MIETLNDLLYQQSSLWNLCKPCRIYIINCFRGPLQNKPGPKVLRTAFPTVPVSTRISVSDPNAKFPSDNALPKTLKPLYPSRSEAQGIIQVCGVRDGTLHLHAWVRSLKVFSVQGLGSQGVCNPMKVEKCPKKTVWLCCCSCPYPRKVRPTTQN